MTEKPPRPTLHQLGQLAAWLEPRFPHLTEQVEAALEAGDRRRALLVVGQALAQLGRGTRRLTR